MNKKYLLLLNHYYNDYNDIDSPFFDVDKYFEGILHKNNIEEILLIHKENNDLIKTFKCANDQLIFSHYNILINTLSKMSNVSQKMNDIIELESLVNGILNNVVDLNKLAFK